MQSLARAKPLQIKLESSAARRKSNRLCRVGTAQLDSDIKIKLAYNGGVLTGALEVAL